MKLEIKNSQEINLELAENLFQKDIIKKLKQKRWVSIESLIDRLSQIGVDVESEYYESYYEGLLKLYKELNTKASKKVNS